MGGVRWFHPDSYLDVEDDCLLVVLWRNPVDVYRSWASRGHSIGRFFREHFVNLYALAEQHESLWVHIDKPCCKEQLKVVSERTGIEISYPLPRLNTLGCPGLMGTLTDVQEDEMMTETEFIDWLKKESLYK